MTELILGTKKGLFVVDGSPESGFDVTTRAFAGEPVDYARRDPRTGRLFATISSPFYGPKIWYADDPGGEWSQADGVSLPEGGNAALERIWVITPGQADGLLYAGGDPGVLFESHDDGATWELNEALWNHPTRPLAARRRRSVPALDRPVARRPRAAPGRGVRRGRLADRRRRSLLAPGQPRAGRALPARGDPRNGDEPVRAPHERSPKRPERLFMQFHGGVYRSDDAGESWSEIGAGLDSDFGFPLRWIPRIPTAPM